MKTHTSMPVVRPAATVAMILGKSASHPMAASPENHSETTVTAHLGSESGHQTTTDVHEEIRRRYETPFRFHGWEHAGINE